MIKTSTLAIVILVIIVLVLAGFILKDLISINVAGEEDQEQTEETTTVSESETTTAVATTTAAGGTTAASTTSAAGTNTASTTAITTASATTAATTTTTNTTAGKPDLTLTSGGLVDMFVLPGETITISGWTVGNVGTVASGNFSNGFYLSNDAVITAGDNYLSGNSNTSLAPGEQFVWGNTTITIPAGTPPGSYHFGILVDRSNTVSESNENNNYWSTAIVIKNIQ